ncbi:MAG: 4-hydroxythreonine-4-phosphate dehydrogenase PdxA, partial [Balneolaceae bacterium]
GLRIAISTGDYNGIGPEVILKTLQETDLSEVTPVITGSAGVIRFYSELLNIGLPFHSIDSAKKIEEGTVNVLESYGKKEYRVNPGELSRKAGKLSMKAVERAIKLCRKEKADAMVTAPISKEAIQKAGYKVPGHTEFLADKTSTSDYIMMMVSGELRIGLATIHVPLAKVPSLLNEATVLRYLRIMHRSLQHDFGIPDPKIAVLGLNPHAGDGGVIGNEEIRYIAPALQKARFNDMEVSGPFAADGFFGSGRYKSFDGILAMYHDQGLIPFKTLSFGAGVNFTAGLPIIRTSPDHGTAFDIAGKNRADPRSFRHAFDLARTLAQHRKKEPA